MLLNRLKVKKLLILFLVLFPSELVANSIKGVWKTELTDEGYYFYITIHDCKYSDLNDNQLLCGKIMRDKSHSSVLNNIHNDLIMYGMKAGTFNSNKEWVEADVEHISNHREFHGYILNTLTKQRFKSRVKLLEHDSLSIEFLGWGYYFNKKKWNRVIP